MMALVKPRNSPNPAPRLALARLAKRTAPLLLATLLLLPPSLLAQAGGGGGAGGSGTGGGAGAGAGSGGAPGGGAPGQAGSASTGATGAAAQSTPGAPAGNGQAGNPSGQSQSPSAYTASASPGSDPRKPPVARPGALTLQQVVERARANNPTLLAAAANLRAVRAQEIQAGVRANPYLGFAGSNVSLPAEGASNPYAYSVQVSRLFERGNKRAFRLQNARATTSQTAAQLEDTTRQTVLAVRSAFTRMLIAKESLELSRAQLADFRHEVDINHDRYTAGDIGKLDFERLDLQLASFESDAANAEIALLQASDQLQTLLGVDTPSSTFDIAGDIVPPIIPETRDALIQTALARRPDLQAAIAGVLAAEATSRLAIANGTADPTLEGEYDRSGTYNSAGFNINLPVRIFDRNQGNKQTARFEIDNAQLSVTAARNQVVSDVDQAWVGYTRAKTLSDRFTTHFLDESTDVLSIARFAYDHGGLALIDYLDALRDARSATSDALNAYTNTWLAIHQLSADTATDLTP